MDKKWRNCELHSTEDAKAIKGIRKYCNTHHIPYETSDAGYGYVHFEIYCDAEQVKTIDNLLDIENIYIMNTDTLPYTLDNSSIVKRGK